MKRRLITTLTIAAAAALLASCTSDKDIKADIAQKAKTDVNFAGVNYTVQNKVVTLTGNCASDESRQKLLQTIKNIHVLKGINNHIQIAPVVLDDRFTLKQAADSVLASYPYVQAQVWNEGILLSGKATKKEFDKLTSAIDKLHPQQLATRIDLVNKEE